MKTVWKYELELVDGQEIMMPAGAEILCIQVQTVPCVWARVEPENEMVGRIIRMYGTGHPLPTGTFTYIGTIQLYTGSLVLHFFEEES